MYKYNSDKVVSGFIKGKYFVLGSSEPLINERPLPLKPIIFEPATQEQLKALYEKGFKFIVKETPKAKAKNEVKESDSGND
jgi:hypothetical protein